MKLKLAQDVEGHKSGETVDVPADRAAFYLAEGYATHPDGKSRSDGGDMLLVSGVPAEKDPRLAENREDPDAEIPGHVDRVQDASQPPAPLTPESFNPDEHTAAQVNAYLASLPTDGDQSERERVLALEYRGQRRKTILEP